MFLEHCLENVCSGNKVVYEYLINWMARVVQEPATSGEVAIVMRGGKGTGKGFFARTFGRLFGRHFMHIANAKHLIGNFNAHLQDCVCLFADEAFFAGDKSHESVLKMLITEDTIPVEKKGYDVESSPNFVHLIMASNDPHVIRATGDERRYLVLDMGEGKKQNATFFGAMLAQLENGGYQALLYYLQSVDIEKFNVRNVPQTDALQEQKLLSMGYDEEWWYRKLQDGKIFESDVGWERYGQTEYVTTDYIKYMDAWKQTRRGNETALGRFLSRIVPHITKITRRVNVSVMDYDGREKSESKRANFYDFGSLDQCRQAWEEKHGRTVWEQSVQLELENPNDVPF